MKRLAVLAACAAFLALPARAEGDAAKGETAFKKCAACHAPDATTKKVGPPLGGVVGRKPASIEGFNYSDAMKAFAESGAVWDEANLDKYIEKPKEFIPKNKMAFAGVKKPEERADLIAYLKTTAGN
jgi:cytochrome c